jgi:hypothetical protein
MIFDSNGTKINSKSSKILPQRGRIVKVFFCLHLKEMPALLLNKRRNKMNRVNKIINKRTSQSKRKNSKQKVHSSY